MNNELDQLAAFQSHVLDFYKIHKRSFAWRYVDDPYKIFISEMMLQQTQTARVNNKYPEFLALFPSFSSLANASLKEVLMAWQGMGYNRRARYIHESAHIIVNQFQAILPDDPAILVTFPGIGPATAASMCAFAYNKPTVFIETNIRSVFIHHFFFGKEKVHDKELLSLIEATLYHADPRSWYYALMDYGVMLKQTTVNPNRKSSSYKIQSRFEGSNRQVRGAIIKILTAHHSFISYEQLYQQLPFSPERIDKALEQLNKDQLIVITEALISIK